MNAERKVSIHPDFAVLAATTAGRLISKLVDVQNDRGEATVVLAGGALATAVLKAVADSPARAAVDWSRINFWWGDERFVPAADADRNALQAREALLSALVLDQSRVHTIGSSDDFDSPDAAAEAYAAELSAAARSEAQASPDPVAGADPRLPRFDVLLLGVGPDAHIASLFPEMAGIRTTGRTVVGVPNSPKPPPQRVSLTLEAINTALEVWLAVAGDDKAGAVGLALAGAGPFQVPAAGARGVRRTLWLIDQEAAAKIPSALLGGGDEDEDDAEEQ